MKDDGAPPKRSEIVAIAQSMLVKMNTEMRHHNAEWPVGSYMEFLYIYSALALMVAEDRMAESDPKQRREATLGTIQAALEALSACGVGVTVVRQDPDAPPITIAKGGSS